MSQAAPAMTIGDCREAGKLLEFGCCICGRHGYFTHDEIGLPDDLSFVEAGWRITCRTCGARNRQEPRWPIWVRPDARVSANGHCVFLPEICHPGRNWYEQERHLKLPINAWLANVRSE